ncbi:MAG: efflux RND transporter periplasmic adaptor subunit, partial [Burkholderiaceae bacterium]
GDAIVRAPIAGIIAKRHVQPGEKVGYDAPLLAIVDLGKLEVQAQAPVADVPQLAPGMATVVQIEGLPGRNFAARLDRINPATETGTRMLSVYVALPNEERLVKAGMFARVLVAIAPPAPVPSLPVASVRSDGVQSYVWVIADGKLARRNVETGRRDERAQRVEIRSALAAKEPVLAGKFDNLKEGLAARRVTAALAPVAV